ncbi:MAG: pyruvate kinase [Pseudomonadota bacterium]
MLRPRNTKIIATIGPASSSLEKIERLLEKGANLFRLNLSHGTHDDHKKRFEIIRTLEQKVGYPIAIMADLQGPKLRIGTFADKEIELETGQSFYLDSNAAPGSKTRVCFPHPKVFPSLAPENFLLLNDGKIRLQITRCHKDRVETTVLTGGTLSDCKGVNIPRLSLPIPALTEKDRQDLKFSLEMGVDIVALSFVQTPDDVLQARQIIGNRAQVLSKIEKPVALDNLDAIIDLSDAVMVARGDLGVEVELELVPGIQKRIIRACRTAGKPVVVATQMLESMITHPTPTRAETSDIATAVFEGVDAVMLSAESAYGAHPIEAVATMEKIIHQVEQDPLYQQCLNADRVPPESTDSDAITMAANQVSRTIGAKAIVTFTKEGSTSLRASRERPEVPILALTSCVQTARQLCLAWGVRSFVINNVAGFTQIADAATHLILQKKMAHIGDSVVLTAGVAHFGDKSPVFTSGTTNMVRILKIENLE